MIYLLLCVLCTASMLLAFKLFERNNISIFQAIVFNYISASVCGFIFLPDKPVLLSGNIFVHPWLPLALFLGGLFFVIFNLTSITAVRYGVSTASVAMKLGLVFPVLLAFTVYGEPFTWLKLLGIVFAFAAVIFSSLKQDNIPGNKFTIALLPLLVFVGSGTCDALTQFADKRYLKEGGMEGFSLFLFLAASLTGILAYTYQFARQKPAFSMKSLIGGIMLGVVNYFSFLFMLKALATVTWGSSVVFPLINLGTVLTASLAGIVLFNEKISKINLTGLLFAIISIIVIAFSN